MPNVKVAHLREQGQDMIIVPMDRSFGSKPEDEQGDSMQELQMRCRAAGLKGTVVTVWDNGGGRMGFIAPRPWHPFFQNIGLSQVWANVNREIAW